MAHSMHLHMMSQSFVNNWSRWLLLTRMELQTRAIGARKAFCARQILMIHIHFKSSRWVQSATPFLFCLAHFFTAAHRSHFGCQKKRPARVFDMKHSMQGLNFLPALMKDFVMAETLTNNALRPYVLLLSTKWKTVPPYLTCSALIGLHSFGRCCSGKVIWTQQVDWVDNEIHCGLRYAYCIVLRVPSSWIIR